MRSRLKSSRLAPNARGRVGSKDEQENEQLTYVLEGGLRFWIGSEDAAPIDVTGGQVLTLPSNVPHKA